MPKKLLLFLFIGNSLLSAMQPWGENEMVFLQERKGIQKQLLNHGIIKLWLANNPLGDENIERIVGQVAVNTFNNNNLFKQFYRYNDQCYQISCSNSLQRLPQVWPSETTKRLRIYLRNRLHNIIQVELLKSIAAKIKEKKGIILRVQNAGFKKFYLKKLQGTSDCDEQEKKVLPIICPEQRSLFKAYLLLPQPLKEIARQYIQLQNISFNGRRTFSSS